MKARLALSWDQAHAWRMGRQFLGDSAERVVFENGLTEAPRS